MKINLFPFRTIFDKKKEKRKVEKLENKKKNDVFKEKI